MSRSATIAPPARTTSRPVPVNVADVGDVDTDPRAPLARAAAARSGDRDDHALLRLGEPDLPRFEAGVLPRDQVEFDVGADALGHLADGRRQPAGAAVGDRRVEILGADERIDQQLLDDRVADLDARSGDLAGGGVHRRRGERGPSDAVTARGAAEHDHPVTGVRTVVRSRAGATPMHPANTSGLVV